jgi:RimJ/RimL family protein N-acetyltransferase
MSWSGSVINMRCRPINDEDSGEVFAWRNDLASREMSLNTGIISWEEHLNWFRGMLKSNDYIGYVGDLNRQKIGVVFMSIDDKTAKISINLNPRHRGKGLGSILLKSAMLAGKKSLPKLRQFSAEIKNTNAASIKIFAENGFKLQVKKYAFSVYVSEC